MELNKWDVVTVTSEGNVDKGKRGLVDRVLGDLIVVQLVGNSYCKSFYNSSLTKVEPPKVGDLVKVVSYGKYQAQEGHVTKISVGYDRPYSVDIGDDIPDFNAIELEVIESLPEPVIREEGKEINPKHLEKGDTIRVEIRRKTFKGVSEVLTAEGVYDYSNNYGTLFTKDYGVLMNAHDASEAEYCVVTLLKKADTVSDKLTNLKTDSIISWVRDGRKVALKREDGNWAVSWNTSYSVFSVEQVRRFISGAGDEYEVLKDGNE